jgi:hypothetical protein
MERGKRLATYARQRGVDAPVSERNDKKVPELQAECLNRGIDFTTKERKGTLIEKLEEFDRTRVIPRLTFRQQRRLRKAGI